MLAYFDIETTGLSDAADFVCAVVMVDGAITTFDTVEATVDWIIASTETIVTWNGLSFDFKFLANKTSDGVRVCQLAFVAINRHVDLMFDFLVAHGYPTSMQSVGEPLGHSKSWSGAEAAESTDKEAVLAYCVEDVKVLAAIEAAGTAAGWLIRLTQMGKRTVWVLPVTNFRSVDECLVGLRTVSPDQSWMTTPINIAGTAEWATAALRQALR